MVIDSFVKNSNHVFHGKNISQGPGILKLMVPPLCTRQGGKKTKKIRYCSQSTG